MAVVGLAVALRSVRPVSCHCFRAALARGCNTICSEIKVSTTFHPWALTSVYGFGITVFFVICEFDDCKRGVKASPYVNLIMCTRRIMWPSAVDPFYVCKVKLCLLQSAHLFVICSCLPMSLNYTPIQPVRLIQLHWMSEELIMKIR